jgi:hypothetical protein
MPTMNVSQVEVEVLIPEKNWVLKVLDELGNWRPDRNRFSGSHFEKYQAHNNWSEPQEDFDDRNALYAM